MPKARRWARSSTPFQRVGIYVPGGTAPLVSTCLMTITLARAAGCNEIVVCTPCGADGQVNPGLLFAARTAGATEVYRVRRFQAIAAMACGNRQHQARPKSLRPRHAYVVTAKRLLFGRVAMDLLPGPSEVLVLADDPPIALRRGGFCWPRRNTAPDMNASGWSRHRQSTWRCAEGNCPSIADAFPARVHQARAQSNGWLIQVKSLEDGIALVNQIAPEHCEVMVRKAEAATKLITTAGAIFVGAYSPTVLGITWPAPATRCRRAAQARHSPVSQWINFSRRTSVVEYNRASLKKSLAAVREFAALEGLDAHGRSLAIRLEGR